MATHTVKGIITYPFEVEVDTDSADGYTVSQLFDAVGAVDGYAFGRLAFDGDDIMVHDSDAQVSISAVEVGGIEWVDDGLPYAGVSDGKGGIIWQEV